MIAPVPGQPWSIYHEGGQGIPSGERLFVVATLNSERVTLLSLFDLQPLDMPVDAFASLRRKTLADVPARRLAARIRRNMKEREAYRPAPDAEIAELALSAIGWKHDPSTKNGAQDMLDVAIGERTYTNSHGARRAAARALGKPNVAEGVDFEIKPVTGGKVAMVLKTGSNGKTEKVAAGLTGIERQYAGVKGGATPVSREAFAKAAIAHASAGLLMLAAPKTTAKPKGKPAKAPKPKKAAKTRVKTVVAPKAAGAGGKGKPAGKAGSKVAIVAGLLQKPEGTTTAEILAVCKWPAVSVPAQAKAAGLSLRKEKKPGDPTRYYGTPL